MFFCCHDVCHHAFTKCYYLSSFRLERSGMEKSPKAEHCSTICLYAPYHGILRFGIMPHTTWRQNDIFIRLGCLRYKHFVFSSRHDIKEDDMTILNYCVISTEGSETTEAERSLMIDIFIRLGCLHYGRHDIEIRSGCLGYARHDIYICHLAFTKSESERSGREWRDLL